MENNTQPTTAPTQGAPLMNLNQVNWQRILDGAIVTILGALVTYAVQVIGQINFGPALTPLVTALGGIVAALVRETLAQK